MTTDKIKALIAQTIQGQGDAVDVGGGLAKILTALADGINEVFLSAISPIRVGDGTPYPFTDVTKINDLGENGYLVLGVGAVLTAPDSSYPEKFFPIIGDFKDIPNPLIGPDYPDGEEPTAFYYFGFVEYGADDQIDSYKLMILGSSDDRIHCYLAVIES